MSRRSVHAFEQLDISGHNEPCFDAEFKQLSRTQLEHDAYGEVFSRLSVGYYRDGNDSVAWHGDYVARNMPQALVATISVGAPRTFLIRPRGGGAALALSLGWGDLLVMGGTCQRTFEHAAPKRSSALPRIAIMFRPEWQTH